MILTIGTLLGPYKIISQLGAGGMGVVYRARDERLQRDVAIKVLHPGLLADERARKRFHQEALALARVSHPNIAAVFDVGEQDGMDYLVMECIAGESLARKVQSAALAPKVVADLGLQIANALEEAHEQGVVHRDLKPGNIMVTPKGHIKVLDFGLAKLFTEADSHEVTQSFAETRGPLGTLSYMSPEQAEGKPVDARTDLWSLGVVLYESLAHKRPFEGDTAAAVLRAVSNGTPRPLREVCPSAPEESGRIISHALEKDVSKRYQSASEMSRDLSSLLMHLSGPIAPARNDEIGLPRRYLAPVATAILVLGVLGYWLYHRSQQRRWAREEAIPEIAKLQDSQKPLAAFLLMQSAKRILGDDPQLAKMEADDTQGVSVTSSPVGADVEIQDYLSPDDHWHNLGVTPLNNIRIPSGYFRWKVSKAALGEYVAAPPTDEHMNFALDEQHSAPDGMVWVKGGPWASVIDFVGFLSADNVPSFYMDRFEVTNRQYQEFVDKGGYTNPKYWTEPFVQNGKQLTWDQAKTLFRDTTGRAGPVRWEGGHYPEGQADFPVSGVSWYEANAYAAFAGKSLPAFTQWYEAAPSDLGSYVVHESNISLSKLMPVGAFKGLGPFGTYDMAGNVREWVRNSADANSYFILGGAWKSPTYMYGDPEALSPFDRSPENGFRCVRNITALPPALLSPIKGLHRDFSQVKPISDDVYRSYQALYSYDKTPLNSRVEGVVQDAADWRVEKITFDVVYAKERMAAYLFIPKKVQPPYQTVVFFPSARVLDIRDSRTLGDVKFFDYIVQSGRAVLYPVYRGTYERRVRFFAPGESEYLSDESEQYKDLSRSVDYLETRSDIDKNNLAYLGVSMGAAEGVIYMTLLQERLKTAILLDGGYFLNQQPVGADAADFAPRMKKPVLMVNGRDDYVFSLDRAQQPLFRMVGTPDSEKEHLLLDTSHDVTERHSELVSAVLGWLDKYLGRVD